MGGRMKDAGISFAAVAAMAVLPFVSASAAGVGEDGRVVTDLSGGGWTFDGRPVSVPHTWNAVDGADGIGPKKSESVGAVSYARRRGLYRRSLPNARKDRRYFVRCRGVCQKATVRVNGVEIGRHVGAFTAFAFEATHWMKPSGNVLEIEADNTIDPDVPPRVGDWTMFGGVYRKVELIETGRICIDCVTDGADGVRIDADPDTGVVTAYVSVDGGTNEVQRFAFPDRELWSPENPRLYTLDIAISQGGCTDSIRQSFGFRKAEFREDGFYLNGVKRRIRGVNMHQGAGEPGWAVAEAQFARDVAMVKEMGADGIRTGHYPHAWETYGECDRQGVVVWCEFPNVDWVGATETYRTRAIAGIREMVVQLRNHPSIVTWSIGNEYRVNARLPHDWVKRVLADSAAEMRRLDPSRAVSAATCRPELSEINAIPDVLGFNVYPGWSFRYAAEDTATCIEDALRLTPRATFAISEYGAGGNIDRHDSPDVRSVPKSPSHPEEYQAWCHHFQYAAFKADPRIWGTFVWAMYDIAADGRREGSRFGINDKGLVTYDHKTPKDAFWFYKANWNPEPLLHLVGSRMTETTNGVVSVMAFTNVGDATLYVNGAKVGVKKPDEVNTAIWRGVALSPGANSIKVKAGGISREAVWNLTI